MPASFIGSIVAARARLGAPPSSAIVPADKVRALLPKNPRRPETGRTIDGVEREEDMASS